MPSIELVSVLRAHSIAINESLVEAALRDPEVGPGLADWAQTHLTTDTLLTVDELDLYDALQRSGRDQELADAVASGAATAARAAPEGGSGSKSSKGGLPVTDGALRTATAALEASTAAITRQSDALRQQQEAVARLAASASTSQGQHNARAAFEARHRKQWAADRADLVAAVAGLARNLDVRVDELAQQNGELAQRVRQTVDGLCRSDDKLLASLQKLGWALPVSTEDDDEDEKRQQQAIGRLRDICLHLIKSTVEGIRTKLDRLYLEALEAAQAEQAQQEADDDDVAALQDELESLYAEILPVAQMSVEQQYLEPALASLSGTNGRNLARSLLALDYIDECLDFLVEHIALLTRRIETAAAHHAAAEALLAAARTELAVHVPIAPPAPPPGAGGSSSALPGSAQRHQKTLSLYGSPVRRRGSPFAGGGGGAAGHLRTMSGGGDSPSKGLRRRSSGFGSSGLGQVAPMDELLESLSIMLPGDDGGDNTNSIGGMDATATAAVNAAFLHAALTERLAKADGVAANAQEAYEAASASHVADALRATWMARESVLGESAYGGGAVQLADPEIEGSLAVMAHEVARLRTHLGAVHKDLDAVRRGRSAKREQITTRWM